MAWYQYLSYCCPQERSYLDTIFTAIGAVLGFQNCSEVMEIGPFALVTDLGIYISSNPQILVYTAVKGSFLH